jgi:hypothetical protein
MRALSSGELCSSFVGPNTLRTDLQLCHLSGRLVTDLCSCQLMPMRAGLEVDVLPGMVRSACV